MVQIPRVQAAPGNARGAAQNPVAGDFGAAGRGLQQAGNSAQQLGQFVHQTNVKADRLKAREQEQRFLTALDENMRNLDPLQDDYAEEAESTINETINQFGEEVSFKTGEGSAEFRARMEALGQAQVRTAFQDRDQALEARGVRNFNEDRQALLANIGDDPANADVYLAEFNADVANTYSGVIPQGDLEKLALETVEAAILAEAEGLAEAGNYKGAREVLDANRGNLNPDQYRFGKRNVRAIQERKRSDFQRATAGEVADLQIMVSRASTPEEVAAARTAVAEAEKRGIFNGRQGSRARLTTALDRQQEAAREQQEARGVLTDRMASGAPARSQDEADAMWTEYMANLQGDGDQPPNPQQTVDQLHNFVRTHGRVPTPIKQRIELGERSNDPEQLAAAATLAMTVESAEGNADVFDLADDSPVARVMSQVENRGVSINDAARNVLSATDQDNVRRNRLREDFDNEIGGEFDADAASDILARAGIRGVSPGPAAVEAVRKAFRAQFVAAGGDQSAAEQATAAWARQRFGVSNVGGSPRLIDRHEQGPAPEAYIPPSSGLGPRQRATLIDQEIRRTLAQDGLDVPEDATVTLRPDRQTQEERRRGEIPSFPVIVDGNPVVDEDENGTRRPVRYTPPVDVEDDPFFQQLIREAQERARARREDRGATSRRNARNAPEPDDDEADFDGGDMSVTLSPEDRRNARGQR